MLQTASTQIRPDSYHQGPSCSGSKLLDILMVFLKHVFEKDNFEQKISRSVEDKKLVKLLRMQGFKPFGK